MKQAAKAVLAELDRCNGHLIHDLLAATVNLYHGDPAVRGLGQPVDMDTFTYLRDNDLITRIGEGAPLRGSEQKQYEINETGRDALR